MGAPPWLATTAPTAAVATPLAVVALYVDCVRLCPGLLLVKHRQPVLVVLAALAVVVRPVQPAVVLHSSPVEPAVHLDLNGHVLDVEPIL